MKCDLCKHEKEDGFPLCGPCSEMVARLLTIERRLKTTAAIAAERLSHDGQALGASR